MLAEIATTPAGSRNDIKIKMKLQFYLVLSIAALVFTACAPSPTTQAPTLAATLSIAPTEASVAAFTPTPLPSLTPIITISPITPHPQIVVLATNLPEPDDLLLAPDGSIYQSDVGDGIIWRYTKDNGAQIYLSGFNEPEGMVILPDGSLIIVEQRKNRLVRYDPTSRTLTTFLNLRNTTDQMGVDGIALDDHNPNVPTLIVPDSPNGTVLRVSLDGKTVTKIASGFVRPTGAWVEPDGSILISDEYGNSLDRIRLDDTVEKLATLPTPDDVVEDAAGNIFVSTLGDNAIHLISFATKQNSILISDIIQPQGIIFDSDGNLIVTDPGNHRLIKLIIH